MPSSVLCALGFVCFMSHSDLENGVCPSTETSELSRRSWGLFAWRCYESDSHHFVHVLRASNMHMHLVGLNRHCASNPLTSHHVR